MERTFHMLATFPIKKWMNYSLIWFVCGAFACVNASPFPFSFRSFFVLFLLPDVRPFWLSQFVWNISLQRGNVAIYYCDVCMQSSPEIIASKVALSIFSCIFFQKKKRSSILAFLVFVGIEVLFFLYETSMYFFSSSSYHTHIHLLTLGPIRIHSRTQ